MGGWNSRLKSSLFVSFSAHVELLLNNFSFRIKSDLYCPVSVDIMLRMAVLRLTHFRRVFLNVL